MPDFTFVYYFAIYEIDTRLIKISQAYRDMESAKKAREKADTRFNICGPINCIPIELPRIPIVILFAEDEN